MKNIKLEELAKYNTKAKVSWQDDYLEDGYEFNSNYGGYAGYLMNFLSEIDISNALLYFGIKYNKEKQTLSIPDDFNPTLAREVLQIIIKISTAVSLDGYNPYTSRVASSKEVFDETCKYISYINDYMESRKFDYCEDYIYNIFEALEMEYAINPWN